MQENRYVGLYVTEESWLWFLQRNVRKHNQKVMQYNIYGAKIWQFANVKWSVCDKEAR